MDLLPDYYQAYQEEQQVQICAWQVNTELWAAQHHDELTSEQATLKA
jgi:hypothetical protein